MIFQFRFILRLLKLLFAQNKKTKVIYQIFRWCQRAAVFRREKIFQPDVFIMSFKEGSQLDQRFARVLVNMRTYNRSSKALLIGDITSI
jgi:hypothetical protein